ncbi:unnamed protein product [Closterium sp. NIES-65]|nr:unnamed protein product [Closterium sp. NIES-65]
MIVLLCHSGSHVSALRTKEVDRAVNGISQHPAYQGLHKFVDDYLKSKIPLTDITILLPANIAALQSYTKDQQSTILSYNTIATRYLFRNLTDIPPGTQIDTIEGNLVAKRGPKGRPIVTFQGGSKLPTALVVPNLWVGSDFTIQGTSTLLIPPDLIPAASTTSLRGGIGRAIGGTVRDTVTNFKGNQHKSFTNLDEALSYLALANALYRMEFDGASKGNPGRAGAGSVLWDEGGNESRGNWGRAGAGSMLWDEHDNELVCMREGVGHGTCNMAEYRAFIGGVELALALGITRLHVQGDSMLVVMQVQKKWKVNAEMLRGECKQAQELVTRFKEISIRHVPRECNQLADLLSNEAVPLKENQRVIIPSICTTRFLHGTTANTTTALLSLRSLSPFLSPLPLPPSREATGNHPLYLHNPLSFFS